MLKNQERTSTNISLTFGWLSAIAQRVGGSFALCLAMFAIACASILIVIAQEEIGSNAITCDRLWIAATAFAFWNGIKIIRDRPTSEVQWKPTFGDLGLFIIAGVSFAASLSLWAWSLTQTSVANSTLLNNMMPIFTTFGAWLLFAQQFKAKFLLGMLVAIGGAIAIGIQDLQVSNAQLLGDGAALLASALCAITLLSMETLRLKFSTPIVMQWTSAIGSLFLLPIVIFKEGQLLPTTWQGWSSIILLGIVCQVIGIGHKLRL